MTYLRAHHCLASSGEVSTENIRFLKQVQTAYLHRAFAKNRLSIQDLTSQIHHSINQAAAQSGWNNFTQIPIFIGSTAYTMAHYEHSQVANSFTLDELAQALQRNYGYAHINCFATSCTSAAHALAQAHFILTNGWTERAFLVGAESHNLLTLLHFHSLGLLKSPQQPQGFILGEGIATLALETSAKQSGLHLIASHSHTQANISDHSADGIATLMQHVLAQANLSASDIAAIKLHAIGTPSTDQAELAAIDAVFAQRPALHAFKNQVGHTLGASGAIEIAAWQNVLHDFLHTQTQNQTAHFLALFLGFGGNAVAQIWKHQP
ncbi:MAG: beta-ketoacyl synthase [Neisseria sp.]|nr:beta-ketoacyl synthase [Neisseria sp.]